MIFKGRKNIYTCEECGGHIVTVDLEEGVTPFMVGCRATEGCEGMMKSSMYRVFDQTMATDHEWYKPGINQALSTGEADHVNNGGLLLRKVQK